MDVRGTNEADDDDDDDESFEWYERNDETRRVSKDDA
jgi:hypothetical protein